MTRSTAKPMRRFELILIKDKVSATGPEAMLFTRMSNSRSAFGGMTPLPAPFSPYASFGGIRRIRLPPDRTPYFLRLKCDMKIRRAKKCQQKNQIYPIDIKPLCPMYRKRHAHIPASLVPSLGWLCLLRVSEKIHLLGRSLSQLPGGDLYMSL
jgi:hypothetical protein